MAEAGAGSPHGGDAAPPGPPEEQELSRRLRRLYPAVNQDETPLPRSWSPKDKYNYIGLSQGNLRVHYKGAGLGRRRRAASARSGTAPAGPSARPLRGALRARAEPAAGPVAPGQGRREQRGDGRRRAPGSGSLLGPEPRLRCSGRAAGARERRRWGAGGSARRGVWPYITLCCAAGPGPVRADPLFTLSSCSKPAQRSDRPDTLRAWALAPRVYPTELLADL